MKKNVALLALFFLISGLFAFPTLAQGWTTYESEQFDLQFDIPDHWTTEVDGDMLVSSGDGIVFVLAAVKDGSISTEQLFHIQVDNLDIDSEIEYEDIELSGGILGVIGSGAGEIEGQVVGIILLAATLDENNYFAYIFATPESFDDDQNTMVEVLTSLAPLGWE